MFNKDVFQVQPLCAAHNAIHRPLHRRPSSVYNLCSQGLTIRMHLHDVFSLVIPCNCSPNDKGGAGWLPAERRQSRTGAPEPLEKRAPQPLHGPPILKTPLGHSLAPARIQGGHLYDTPASLTGVAVRIPIGAT